MGNVISSGRRAASLTWWSSSSNGHVPAITAEEQNEENDEDRDDAKVDVVPRALSPAKAKEMEEFKKQLLAKREARRKIIAERSKELQKLKQQLEDEKKAREEVEDENKRLRTLIAENNCGARAPEQAVPSDDFLATLEDLQQRIDELKEQNKAIRCELAECNMTHQSVITDLALVNKENFELRKHVDSLKDVNKVSKDMLSIRETQLTQLKEKLTEIEKSLADREMKTLSNDLRSEYERQLENIRNLRVLYEERARIAEVTRQNLLRDLDEQKSLVASQSQKCVELETRIEELEKEVSDKDDILGKKDDQLGLSKAETRDLKDEMSVINKLFSKMLLGYNSNQDLDKLVLKLEENHDLLTDMVVREESSDISSALPKLILDLLNQTADETKNENSTEENNDTVSISEATEENNSKLLTSAEEIVGNLPKVWRVLMELLSHQAPPQVIVDEGGKSTSLCYKSVETPSGPRMVPSVSKTYIRLKDLILEKKSLQKDMNHLKQLNGHLENRLQDQERRLSLVSSELNKTWHIVGRMQRQHQQLHSHEQILRYELQQKRILLKELREELEFCKEKWDKAKQKNSESQIEWDKLRLEFASRKVKSTDSVNNSAESGYSDEKASDDDSIESNNEKKNDRKRIKKKSKSPDADELSIEIKNKNLNLLTDNVDDSDDIAENLSEVDEQEPNNLTNPEVNLINSENNSKSNSRLSSIEKDSTDPSTSNSNTVANYDDVLAARSARLKKLEEQCYVLVHKVTKTNNKGVELCNRLEELHNQYGGSEDSSEHVSVEREIPDDIPSTAGDEKENVSTLDISLDRTSANSSPIKIEDTGGTNIVQVDEDALLNVPQTSQEENNEKSEAIEEKEHPTSTNSNKFDYEARFAARDARLKCMEEQAKSLVKQVTNTSTRSDKMSSKLTDLHNTYGRSEEENTNSTSSASEEIPVCNDSSSSHINSNAIEDNTKEENAVENICKSEEAP